MDSKEEEKTTPSSSFVFPRKSTIASETEVSTRDPTAPDGSASTTDDPEWNAKAATRPKNNLLVAGEEDALERFNKELEKMRATREVSKIAATSEKEGGSKKFGSRAHLLLETEGKHPDAPIRLTNIFSTPQLITFKIPKLPAMTDVYLALDMGKHLTSLAVLPAIFEPDSDSIGPKAKHLGNLATSAASASLRLYMSNVYHTKAADYLWQEEMGMLDPALFGGSDKAGGAETTDGSSQSGPVQSKLLGPKAVAAHKSFSLPYSKTLGYTGDTAKNLCNTPVLALKDLSGMFYFAVFSSVPLANVEISCRVNQRTVRDEDDLSHPWRISRMFTVTPYSHDAFMEWFARNKTLLTLGATSLVEPTTRMNPLHVAMGYLADPRLVRVVIKHCGKFVKLNATDAEGQSPIFKLVRRADVYSPNSTCYYRALELLKLMAVDAGCYLDLQDAEGNTLLHFAARHHKVGSQLFAKLLEYGAQTDMRNNAGRTPVQEAEVFGGVTDLVSGEFIPRILPLDLREVRQLLAAAEASRTRQREEEMAEITRKIVIGEGGFLDSRSPLAQVAARDVIHNDITQEEERYPTKSELQREKTHEERELREFVKKHPAPGPEDAQLHMGHMRMVPESEKRTIRAQWALPRPREGASGTVLTEEGSDRLKTFPTHVVRTSKKTGELRLVDGGALHEDDAEKSCSSSSEEDEESIHHHEGKRSMSAGATRILSHLSHDYHHNTTAATHIKSTPVATIDLYEPPIGEDSKAIFVPFSKRISNGNNPPRTPSERYAQQILAAAGGLMVATTEGMAMNTKSDLNMPLDPLLTLSLGAANSATSALDLEVAAMNRRRRGEEFLPPSGGDEQDARSAATFRGGRIRKPTSGKQRKATADSHNSNNIQSAVASSERNYNTYVTAALDRAGALSFRSAALSGGSTIRKINTTGSASSGTISGGAAAASASVFRLPPIELSEQRALFETLMQKRRDAERGRPLEECLALAETKRRNMENGKNDGTINVPSFSILRAHARNAGEVGSKQSLYLSRGEDDGGRKEGENGGVSHSLLRNLRTGKGLPKSLTPTTEAERLQAMLEGRPTNDEIIEAAEEASYKMVNPEYTTLGGFRGSYGLEALNASSTAAKHRFVGEASTATSSSGGGVGANRHAGGEGIDGQREDDRAEERARKVRNAQLALLERTSSPNQTLDLTMAATSSFLTAEDEEQRERLYRVRRSVEDLHDVTNIPTHILIKLQKEYDALERCEGRGYLTVGQLVNVIKNFDAIGVPRSEREIEEIVRLGGIKRAHRHHLKHKAVGSSIVPPDGISFNDYCAVMLRLNML